jgi:hypothetical protein
MDNDISMAGSVRHFSSLALSTRPEEHHLIVVFGEIYIPRSYLWRIWEFRNARSEGSVRCRSSNQNIVLCDIRVVDPIPMNNETWSFWSNGSGHARSRYRRGVGLIKMNDGCDFVLRAFTSWCFAKSYSQR